MPEWYVLPVLQLLEEGAVEEGDGEVPILRLQDTMHEQIAVCQCLLLTECVLVCVFERTLLAAALFQGSCGSELGGSLAQRCAAIH
jgi:hypothetical protein